MFVSAVRGRLSNSVFHTHRHTDDYFAYELNTVKKSYYKLSLPVHPEIAGKKYKAARKFQALGKIYSVLSDVSKRRLYNREGS